MTGSIEETLKLIQITLEKVTQTGDNVRKITADSSKLGEHIQVIDTAIKGVEASNGQLVENMQHVSEIVDTMTNCINDSDDISKRMVSKYDESAGNINNIENVIQGLMCELGIGGFMGIGDVQPGMKILVNTKSSGSDASSEYHGSLVSRDDDTLTITLDEQLTLNAKAECSAQVTVGNVLYCWDAAEIASDRTGGTYTIHISSAPHIINRRKYPRIDISNICTIKIKDTGETFTGRLDNLSANGFALLAKDAFFAGCKGKDIAVTIHNFDMPDHAELDGRIIRCSNNDGVYIIGCQMPDDNEYIRSYVEKKLATQENAN